MNNTLFVDLSSWIKRYPCKPPSEQKEHLESQLFFITKTMIKMADEKYEHEWVKKINILVIGEYEINSLLYPTYLVSMPNGDQFVMRENPYNWRISAKTMEDMEANFCRLFNENEEHGMGGCDGFPSEWVFSSWANNKREFTIELDPDTNKIYMFFRIYFFQVSKEDYNSP